MPVVGGVVNSVYVQYDNEDNVTQVTDERGKIHSWTYDDRGLPVTYTNALSQTEIYTYTATGLRATVTNGRNFTRIYSYTDRGELWKLAMPDGSTEYWTYNVDGSIAVYSAVASLSPYAMETKTYSYDFDGRTETVVYSGSVTPQVTFDYSDPGDPVFRSMTDGTGTTTWTYDDWGNLASLATPQGASTYTSNWLGERTLMVDPAGTTTYGYNAKGLLTSLLNPLGETTSYEYDGALRLSKRTLGHGAYEETTYDARSRPTAIRLKQPDTTLLRARTYTYDAASNMLTNAVTGQPMTTYGYDDLNQLLSETRTGYAASYTYDANGNRATKTLNGVTETYTSDAGDKLLSITGGAGTRTYTYDALGRRKTRAAGGQTVTYNWDAESRLLSMSGGGLNTAYTYNGFDARTSASDGLGSRTFRRDGASVTSPLMADGLATYTPGVSEKRPGTPTRYLHSGLKNADSRTTTATALDSTRVYDAFGNVTDSTGTWTGQQGYAGAFGYQEDPTGLMLLGHRYYDAETGRFISRDPISDGRNWYAYCENNPTTSHDPSGLSGKYFIGYGVGLQIARLPQWAQGAIMWLFQMSPESVRRMIAAGNAMFGNGGNGPILPARFVSIGQNPATLSPMRAGQLAHRFLGAPLQGMKDVSIDRQIGFGYKLRPDVVFHRWRHIVEFKPDNPRAIQEGLKQAERYAKIMEQIYGGTWTYEVVPYVLKKSIWRTRVPGWLKGGRGIR